MSRYAFTADDQRVLVESSTQFVNVRVSVNNGEPIAIPAELCAAVAAAIAAAGRVAAQPLPELAGAAA